MTNDPSQTPGDEAEASADNLLGGLAELDNRAPEEALAVYEEISAALVAALDDSAQQSKTDTPSASPPSDPSDSSTGGV